MLKGLLQCEKGGELEISYQTHTEFSWQINEILGKIANWFEINETIMPWFKHVPGRCGNSSTESNLD